MISAPLETRFSDKGHRDGEGIIPKDGQRQPQEEDELEGIVEGEPVNDADKALDHTAKSVSHRSRAYF